MPLKKNTTTTVIGLSMLTIGLVSGFFARPYFVPMFAAIEQSTGMHILNLPQIEAAEEEPEAPATHGNERIVELAKTTVDNMELKTGKFEVRDYFETIVLPAEFVERLPDGRHQIVAPIGGQVEQVFVSPGQAVSAGAPLFQLRVTDEQVSEAQVAFLSVMSDLDSNSAQLERSRRLADREIIAGKKVIELELKLNELNSRRRAIEQELLLRGLSEEQLRALIDHQTLVSSLTIYAPELPTNSSDPARNMFTVETLESTQRQKPGSRRTAL